MDYIMIYNLLKDTGILANLSVTLTTAIAPTIKPYYIDIIYLLPGMCKCVSNVVYGYHMNNKLNIIINQNKLLKMDLDKIKTDIKINETEIDDYIVLTYNFIEKNTL
jgi:hypothetical protein